MLLTPVPPGVPELGSLLLCHGSGSPSDSPFLNRAAEVLAGQGLAVCRFELKYMARRRGGGRAGFPPPLAVLVQELAEVWEGWQAAEPRYLGGKSLGARLAMEGLSQLPAAGALALGYPFHPQGRPSQLRLLPLQEASRPVLVVQGTRDPFGRRQEVEGYGLSSWVTLEWLEGADHDFRVTRKAPYPWSGLSQAVRGWLAGLP